jgi:hypothetical protein
MDSARFPWVPELTRSPSSFGKARLARLPPKRKNNPIPNSTLKGRMYRYNFSALPSPVNVIFFFGTSVFIPGSNIIQKYSHAYFPVDDWDNQIFYKN